jgi:hypothetical protein
MGLGNVRSGFSWLITGWIKCAKNPLALNIPSGVNHLEAHLHSILEHPEAELPMLQSLHPVVTPVFT